MKSAAAALLLLALCVGGAAQTLPVPADQGTVKLSRRERKERTAKLTEPYRQFLIDVDPIIQPSELDTFLRLESDAQRDLYITDFWRRHDLTEGMPNGAFKNIYYERIAEAKERYRSLASDRGRVYVIHGAPAEISIPNSCKFFQPMELWTYRSLKGFEKEAHFLFYRPRPDGDYVLWQPYSAGNDALYDLFSEEIIATTTTKAAAFE